MSLATKLSQQIINNLEQLREDGQDYLYNLVYGVEEIEEEDKLTFSYRHAIHEYEERFGTKLDWVAIDLPKKEEIRICPSADGYVKGTGEEIARVVLETKDVIIVSNPTQEQVPEKLEMWQWPLGREQLSQENTYKDRAANYEFRFQNAHTEQVKQLIPLLPQGLIYELGAGAGMLVHLREQVVSSDMNPRHPLVKKGEMNEEILSLPLGTIVFIQYGYTFLKSEARKRLRLMKYIVIDDIKSPIWLERSSPTLWSNCIKGFVTPDRTHILEPNIMFTDHLLNLSAYQVYSENEYVTYLRAMGRNPSNNGPYIAASLKEYVRIVQDIGTEVYFASSGRVLPISTAFEVGTTMHVHANTVLFFPGIRKFKGGYVYEEGDTYMLANTFAFREQTGEKVIKWKMVATAHEDFLVNARVEVSAKKLIITNGIESTYETNDKSLEVQYNLSLDVANKLGGVALLTDSERIMLKNYQYHSNISLRSLQKKKCLKINKGQVSMTELGISTLRAIDNTEMEEVYSLPRARFTKGKVILDLAVLKEKSMCYIYVVEQRFQVLYHIHTELDSPGKIRVRLLNAVT